MAEPVVAREDLVRFVRHPARAFLRSRLGVSLGRPEDELADALPVELEPLERYAVGQRILEARVAGADRAAVLRAEAARGELPPLALGRRVVEELDAEVEGLVEAAHAHVAPGAAPTAVDVVVALGAGRRLTGTVTGVRGDVLLGVSFARLGPQHRLAAWVRLLALAAAHPERSFTAVTIGRGPARGSEPVAARRLAGVDAAVARRHLERLVDLRDRGLREPLPLCCRTSGAYVAAGRAGRDPVKAAVGEWESTYGYDKEDRDPEHVRVLGGVVPFATLHAPAPRDDEAGDGWDPREHTRFGRYAERLWAALLEHEEPA
jgi:exodeoxyribonuclease V gamma subunit